jgi:UDP-N-acetylmuramate dehydrogenase
MNLAPLLTYAYVHCDGRYEEHTPMANYTSFHIGGPADLLVMPESLKEIRDLMTLGREMKVPVTIIGNGSNLLVRDGGIRGVVIKLGNALTQMQADGEHITADCGVSLAALSNFAAREGLTGLEFAVGIPGSVGGAVLMNAGAYDGDMSKVVESASVLLPDGSIAEVKKDEFDFSYRHSSIQDHPGVILRVVFCLKQGDKAAIQAKMDDFMNRRRTKQPLELPSAGSMFKRPPGYFAAALIDEAGLRGYRVGDAQVSEKHTGFVVNRGHATAKDVLQLIKDVQDKVYAFKGVRLEPEVRIIGEA